jgi:hypothetical protein
MRIIPTFLNPFHGKVLERVENGVTVATIVGAAAFVGPVSTISLAILAAHGSSRLTRWGIRLRRRVVPRSAQRMAAALQIAFGDGGEVTVEGLPPGAEGMLDGIAEEAREEANLTAAVAALSPRTAANPRARARLRLATKAVREAKKKYGTRARTKANEEMVSDYIRKWLCDRTDIRDRDIVETYPTAVRAYFLEWESEIAARQLDATDVANQQREESVRAWRPSVLESSTASYVEDP